MPDLLTHILLTWTATEIAAIKWPKTKNYRAFAFIGALLPDIGNFTMFLGQTGETLSPYFTPLHSPIGITLLIVGLTLIASKKHQRPILTMLTLGAYLHLTADMLIISQTGRIPLLFPFNFELYSINIFQQGGLLFPTIATILATTSTLINHHKKTNKI